MSKTVKVKITAEVITTLELEENETLEDLKHRWVDIYVPPPGKYGMGGRIDLGANEFNIEILED